MQIYLADKHALAFYKQQATPEFWDKHWSTADLQAMLRNSTNDGLFVPAAQRHLPRNSVILEGGCGNGHIVHALQYHGYKAIGIDYAEKTIEQIKIAVPELDVRAGDVRALELPDASLDGYISVGVIEHFWEGYQPILKEMRRTLKPGGFLFISFPFLSPLRKLKIALRQYPVATSTGMARQQESFYQFGLNVQTVQTDLEALGFSRIERINYDGIKGFKDEVRLFRPFLQSIYDGERGSRLRPYLNRVLLPFSAHMTMLVMQKQ